METRTTPHAITPAQMKSPSGPGPFPPVRAPSDSCLFNGCGGARGGIDSYPLIIILNSPPREEHKPHLHNTQCVNRHASLRHMCDLKPTCMYDDTLPFLNIHPSPKYKEPTHPCLRSHGFGTYCLSSPYLLQMKFPLCNDYLVWFLWLIKERNHVTWVTVGYMVYSIWYMVYGRR